MREGVAVLREVSALGGFFGVETSPPLSTQPWAQMSSLVDGSGGLRDHIDRTATALAAQSHIPPDQVERRVAASIMQQGLMARLVSPALASAAIAGWVPRLELARMWWQPKQPSPVPIMVPSPDGAAGQTAEDLADMISLLVLEQGVDALATAMARETNLSLHISWGNVASSVVGATIMLSRQRPDVAATAADLCRNLLATDLLAEAGDFEPSGQFRRNSCCLYYRLPGGGLCGDCVLSG